MTSDEQIDKALAAFYPGSKGPWPWAARHAMEAALTASLRQPPTLRFGALKEATAQQAAQVSEPFKLVERSPDGKRHYFEGFAAGIEAAIPRAKEIMNRWLSGEQLKFGTPLEDMERGIRALRPVASEQSVDGPPATPAESEEATFSIEQKRGLPPQASELQAQPPSASAPAGAQPSEKAIEAMATALVPFSYGAFEYQTDAKGNRVQPPNQPNNHARKAARAAYVALLQDGKKHETP